MRKFTCEACGDDIRCEFHASDDLMRQPVVCPIDSEEANWIPELKQKPKGVE